MARQRSRFASLWTRNAALTVWQKVYGILGTPVEGGSVNVNADGDLQFENPGDPATLNSLRIVPFPLLIGNGVDPVEVGSKGIMRSAWDGVIIGAYVVSDGVQGDIVIDIQKSPFQATPVYTSITAAARPTLTADHVYEDLVLTGWTTAVIAGDLFRFEVLSASLVTRVTVGFLLRRGLT